jgi:glycosyltransferase involved in cell wall biosynthesis
MSIRVMLLLSADLETEASGGIRTYVRDFVKYSPPDFEISIIGSTSDPRRRPVGEWRSLTYGQRQARFLPIVHIPPDASSRVPDLLRYVSALIVRRRRLELAQQHLQFQRPAVALAFLRYRGPMVQWLHLNPSEFSAHMKWRRTPGLLSRIERLTIRRMDYVFTPGTAVAEAYRRRFPEMAERIRFSPNWYDADLFFLPSPEQRQEARRRAAEALGLELAPDAPLVLFVGRLDPQKDPRLLLDSFALFARRRLGARLAMIGAGKLRGDIERHAAASGIGDRVHLLGSRTPREVAMFMRAADALLMASHTEVSARVALEALGSGLPVVATPAGEMLRVVRHGATGWVVSDRRPESLAEGLEWVVAQPQAELSRIAHHSVDEYLPQKALAPVYEMHRQLAARYSVA